MIDNYTLSDACFIATGKLDSNAVVEGGIYPFYTCAAEPTTIDYYDYDDSVVLIAGNNAQGNFHVNRFTGKFNAYQRTYILTKKEGHDLNYVYYALKLELKRLKEKSQGSQTKFLTMPILNNIHLGSRNFLEQEKIASVLSSLDSKIELNNKINQELEAMAKTLYDYWFVQFDFPNEFGKPYKSSDGKMVYNQELKREIPQGWEIITLNSLLNIDTGYSFESSSYLSAGKYKIITIKNVQHNKLNTEKVDYTNNIPNNIKTTSILNLGDILISLTGDVGRICFVNEQNTLLNQRVGHIFAKDDNFDKGLIYLIMKSETIYTKVLNIATGSNQKNLSGVDLLKLKIPFSKTVINRCSNKIKPIFFKMINLQQQNQELVKLRDWLLPMLMNGQVNIK